MATPLQDRFLILLSRRNHTSTAKALKIDFCLATEFHYLPKAQLSLPNTVQGDSTLLASIRTGRFVTGCQHSSQMRAVSLNQVMIDVLGCGDARENVAQTVTLSKSTVTIGAHYGLDLDILGWSYRRVCVS